MTTRSSNHVTVRLAFAIERGESAATAGEEAEDEEDERDEDERS